jgi:hypothetical protein
MSGHHQTLAAKPGGDDGRAPFSAFPFSTIALSAGDRLGAALVLIGFLWLCVAWALDWFVA